MKTTSRRLLLPVALSLACALLGVGYVVAYGATTGGVSLGQEFKIKPGQEVAVKGENLKVKFVSVPGDSRCPKNVTCIWAGDATVLLSLTRGNPAASQIELHTNGAQEKKYQQYTVRLISLDPYPTTDARKKRNDYTATLLISK